MFLPAASGSAAQSRSFHTTNFYGVLAMRARLKSVQS